MFLYTMYVARQEPLPSERGVVSLGAMLVKQLFTLLDNPTKEKDSTVSQFFGTLIPGLKT